MYSRRRIHSAAGQALAHENCAIENRTYVYPMILYTAKQPHDDNAMDWMEDLVRLQAAPTGLSGLDCRLDMSSGFGANI